MFKLIKNIFSKGDWQIYKEKNIIEKSNFNNLPIVVKEFFYKKSSRWFDKII